MPNIASVLKEEIRRLAKKEVRLNTAKTQRAVATYRREIARLKRQLGAQEKRLNTLQRGLSGRAEAPPAEEDALAAVRFSPRSVKAQRARLGLSALDYGKLVGVSALTVYAWESGKNRPRRAQMASLVAVRGIGKREALQRLAELEQQKARPRRRKAKA